MNQITNIAIISKTLVFVSNSVSQLFSWGYSAVNYVYFVHVYYKVTLLLEIDFKNSIRLLPLGIRGPIHAA